MAKAGVAEYAVLRELRGLLLNSRKAQTPKNLSRWRGWGWRENIHGLFVGPKFTNGSRVADQMCVTFLVCRKVNTSRLPKSMRIPAEIECAGWRVVTDVVATGRMMELQAFRASDQVGHVLAGSGTAALVVRKGGVVCGLSCSHVVARRGSAAPGEVVESPPDFGSSLPVNPVGKLLAGFSKLSADTPSKTDAALFTVPSDSDREVPGVGIPTALSNLSGEELGSSGIDVVRNGRGTGLRRGQVTGHRGTVRLRDDVLGHVAYEDAVLYEIESAGGDSGAAVFRRGTTTAVGMHVGGDSDSGRAVFLPIRHAVARLGFTL